MTNKELQLWIKSEHYHPEESQKYGMVWQVWEDGEITLQKCGKLLWQRTLHSIFSPLVTNKVPLETMPEQYSEKHGFTYVKDEKEAQEVRRAIEDCKD
jgi:hypothetical protein